MVATKPLATAQTERTDHAGRPTSDASRSFQRDLTGPVGQTWLHLRGDADILAVQRIYSEARAAAHCGDDISIRCEDATCFDLGALQLLGELREELRTSQFEFASPQATRVFNGWLALVAT